MGIVTVNFGKQNQEIRKNDLNKQLKNLLGVLTVLQVSSSGRRLVQKRKRFLNRQMRRKNIWLFYKNRAKYGASTRLIPQLNEHKYKNFLRLREPQFNELLELITAAIVKPEKSAKKPSISNSNQVRNLFELKISRFIKFHFDPITYN
jgi:hypothetical protein